MNSTELIKFGNAHLEKTFRWMLEKDLKRLYLFRREITWEDHLKWFENLQKDSSQSVFAIFWKDIHCGNCGYKNISKQDRKAELWIYIGERDLRGKGIGVKAVKKLLDKGFYDFKFEKIYLHVASFNNEAIKLYKYFNFVEEGFFKNDFRFEDEVIDIIRMRIFNYEYKGFSESGK
jgi:RimJ/RimL family protein N-acetyltransferase